MESTTPPRLRRGGVVDEIEMSDGLSVHCVDTTDVVAVDTAHTKDVLSADATDFMSAHTTQLGWRDRAVFTTKLLNFGSGFFIHAKSCFFGLTLYFPPSRVAGP